MSEKEEWDLENKTDSIFYIVSLICLWHKIVDSCKYLGTILDSKLIFESKTDVELRKSQQRLSCLGKIAKFPIIPKTSSISFVGSVLTFSLICWFQSLSVKNTPSRVGSVCTKTTGTVQETLQDLYNKRANKKASAILSDCSHQLHQQLLFLPSASLLRVPPIKTRRFVILLFHLLPLPHQRFTMRWNGCRESCSRVNWSVSARLEPADGVACRHCCQKRPVLKCKVRHLIQQPIGSYWHHL